MRILIRQNTLYYYAGSRHLLKWSEGGTLMFGNSRTRSEWVLFWDGDLKFRVFSSSTRFDEYGQISVVAQNSAVRVIASGKIVVRWGEMVLDPIDGPIKLLD